MKKTANFAASMPYAYITKGKQRVKQFNETIYLKNGDEFEIELFNPTTNKVLAKIEIDGKSIGGNGVVLRPGERVFLERYLNESKKFLFETYKVSGNNSEVQDAIRNNGNVVVSFYNEHIEYPTYNPITWISSTPTLNYPPNVRYFNSTTTTGLGTYYGQTFTTTSFSGDETLSLNSNTSNTDLKASLLTDSNNKKRSRVLTKSKEIETGRVEKGSNSNQIFTKDYTKFSPFYFTQTTWKILPDSQKPFMKEDLILFCSECGAKRKKDSHKFCPHCGTKY